MYLKPLIVQCANATIKSNNPYFKYKYNRIKKRRGHKRAIIAITRMVLTCIYHMFQKQEVFHPAETDYSAIPEEMYRKFQEQYERNAIKRLEKRGYVITPPAMGLMPFIP